jgi:hypothetical protein
MGFEYKILVELSTKQSLKLQQILLQQIGFYRKPYLGHEYIEFRCLENSDPNYMPNLRLLFEIDGIYICNNSITSIWHDLHMIKKYLENNHLKYRIFDYSD